MNRIPTMRKPSQLSLGRPKQCSMPHVLPTVGARPEFTPRHLPNSCSRSLIGRSKHLRLTVGARREYTHRHLQNSCATRLIGRSKHMRLTAGARVELSHLHLEISCWTSLIGHSKESLCIPKANCRMVALFRQAIRFILEIPHLETSTTLTGTSAFANLPARERNVDSRKGNLAMLEHRSDPVIVSDHPASTPSLGSTIPKTIEGIGAIRTITEVSATPIEAGMTQIECDPVNDTEMRGRLPRQIGPLKGIFSVGMAIRHRRGTRPEEWDSKEETTIEHRAGRRTNTSEVAVSQLFLRYLES
jgi:hypothetical protein